MLTGFVILLSCDNKLSCKDIQDQYFSIVEDLNTEKDTMTFLEDLNELIETKSRCLKAYQVRGFFKMLKGNFPSAKKDFLLSIQGDSSVYSYYCLSLLYNWEAKNDSALYFIEKAMRMKVSGKYVINYNNYFQQTFDVGYGKLVFQRGIINYEVGKLRAAKGDFLKSIYHQYEKGEAYAYVAGVYYRLYNMDSACFYQALAKANSYDNLVEPNISEKCKDP